MESISICGSWWRGRDGFERGVDGSPRGYRIVSVDGHEIRHRYQSSCESLVQRQGELVEFPAIATKTGTASFVFNCYDAPNGSTARARLNMGPWKTMPEFAAKDPSNGTVMPHHFRLARDLGDLTSGEHNLELEVTWPDGSVVHEKRMFTVR